MCQNDWDQNCFKNQKLSSLILARIEESFIMADPKDILAKTVQEQGDKIRQLKTEKADKVVIDAEVAILKDLKAQLAALEGGAPNAAATGTANKKPKEKVAKNAFTLKVPKVRIYDVDFPLLSPRDLTRFSSPNN